MPRRSRFDWDEHNIRHIAAHSVVPGEVEAVLSNDPLLIETRMDERSGEVRHLQLGHTDEGRVLFVAWTPRGTKVRPVTAFDANRKTRKDYERRRHEKDTQPVD